MPRIIIAEDDDDVREFLLRAVRRYAPGSVVVAAANGAEAFMAVQHGGCDLLISDQRMPVMTGVELLQALRAQGLLCPSIIISADITAEFDSLDAGASAFLFKPVSMRQLREILAQWLGPNA